MRVYIDTNILVDLVLSRQEFLPNAQRVFALGSADEYRSAIEEQADCIVTRNKKDYKSSTIEVLTPAEFFEKMDLK